VEDEVVLELAPDTPPNGSDLNKSSPVAGAEVFIQGTTTSEESDNLHQALLVPCLLVNGHHSLVRELALVAQSLQKLRKLDLYNYVYTASYD